MGTDMSIEETSIDLKDRMRDALALCLLWSREDG